MNEQISMPTGTSGPPARA